MELEAGTLARSLTGEGETGTSRVFHHSPKLGRTAIPGRIISHVMCCKNEPSSARSIMVNQPFDQIHVDFGSSIKKARFKQIQIGHAYIRDLSPASATNKVLFKPRFNRRA